MKTPGLSKLGFLIACWTLPAASLAAADGLPGTRTVETTREIEARAESVIAAFLEPEQMRAWWGVTRSLVAGKSGGNWCVVWDHYDGSEETFLWSGVLAEVSATRLVIDRLVQLEGDKAILFGPMRLEIEVQSSGGSSRVVVQHHGYQSGEHWDALYEEVVKGWAYVLENLERWLEEGKARRSP